MPNFIDNNVILRTGPANFFEIIEFLEILIFHRKIFLLLLLVGVFEFYWKIFELAP